MSLRVLLALHHRLANNPGDAPAAILALGSALANLGCRVDYFGFEHAFGYDSVDTVSSRLHFPWRLASYLRRRANDYDVIDVSAGDSWVWARHRDRSGSKSPVIIARSSHLEQPHDCCTCGKSLVTRIKPDWKYNLYHGGYRRWEIRQSLQRADHTILGNNRDRDFCLDTLGISPLQLSLLGNGLSPQFVTLAPPKELPPDQPINLISVGEWNDAMGKRCIIKTATELHAQKIPFTQTLLDTVLDEVQVRTDFPSEVRPHIHVIPQSKPADVSQVFLDHHIMLISGKPDSNRLTLPERMACGLATIAVREFDIAKLIVPHVNGETVDSADPHAFAAIVEKWSTDRQTLQAVRHAAHKTGERHDWHSIASQTALLYETVLSRALGTNAPRLVSGESYVPETSTNQHTTQPTLSICICTTNRPSVLRRCLASIEQGEVLPTEVVVCDDTLDGAETAAVCGDFPFVRYVRGPRRGLCANRNVVVAAASADYVALLDDDSEVTPQFVRLARDLIARSDGKTIFAGDVLEDGVDRVPPTNPTFWGHFGKPLAIMGQCETVDLNCNIFPRSAFNHARFDERIVYGYENMDLCQQMLQSGHRIEYRRELVNLHLPPPRSPQIIKSQDAQAIRARYYTSLKRYIFWQSRPLRALAYAALAPLHQAAHHLIHRQLSQAAVGFSDMSWAVHQALQFRKAAKESSMDIGLNPDEIFPKQ